MTLPPSHRWPPDEQHQTLCAFYAKLWMGPLTVAKWLDGQEGRGALIGGLSRVLLQALSVNPFRKRFFLKS